MTVDAISRSTSTDEGDRLAALDRYGILHTFDEPEFDELVELACDLTGAPIATVSLLTQDEEWFKARVGMQMAAIPREHSFAALTMSDPHRPLVVADTTCEARLSSNPYVTGDPALRAYVGVPILTMDDQFLGAFEVLDTTPRAWSEREVRQLTILAHMVQAYLEMRRLFSVTP
jgi:GAF domain-containing protein